MAQQGKAPAIKPDDLSSMPGNQVMKGRTKSYLLTYT